jgi:hypothetical protein
LGRLSKSFGRAAIGAGLGFALAAALCPLLAGLILQGNDPPPAEAAELNLDAVVDYLWLAWVFPAGGLLCGVLSSEIRAQRVWLIANAIGGVIYTLVSSTQWVEPEIRMLGGNSGGPLIVFSIMTTGFLFVVIPVLLAWVVAVLVRGFQTKNWYAALLVLYAFAAWYALLRFNVDRVYGFY